MSAKLYGDRYWCVKSGLSPKGEIYVFADRVEVKSGCLIMTKLDRRGEEGPRTETNLIFAPGEWKCCFAASCIDGHAVAVEVWEGEVVR